MARTDLALVAYLTADYDRAIAWFRDGLGFVLLEDTAMGGEKRWVRVAARPDADTGFLIARAVGKQAEGLGRAAGGRVAYFLFTDDFAVRKACIEAAGGLFEEAPRVESYGTVAVFRDPEGNRWDLIEPV